MMKYRKGGQAMIEKYLARAIIRHLDGDKELSAHYSKQAYELYKRDKHLYVPIEEILREKGIA